jgi:hypothetical protein
MKKIRESLLEVIANDLLFWLLYVVYILVRLYSPSIQQRLLF